jgi:hypothetical protein
MKKHASFYWASFTSLAVALLSIALPGQRAAADDASSNSVPPAATAPAAAQAPALPFGVSEVVKMYQGGISKEVMVGYIDNSVLPFHLDADGIIYLKKLGMPQEVTYALIQRDGELQRHAAAANQQQQQLMAASAPNNPAPGTPAAPLYLPATPPPPVAPYNYADVPPPPAPSAVYPDYALYPYYPYYGPDVIVGGWGWGWGWGPRGWGWGWGHGGWGHGGFGHGGFGHGGGHR